MNNLIITRKIDELGRIVIPIEIREELKIKEGQEISLFIEENKLILSLNLEKKDSIIRKIDEIGRIVIPIEIRKTLKLEEKQDVNMYTNNNNIIVQKEISSSINI